jgi:DNA polymerase III gamma/tau subunit
MDAILALLERYVIDDPAAGKADGEFTNPDLRALYDQLVAQGSQSLSEALKVGAAIEEIDILDLEERIAKTDMADIIAVYQNLLKGSRNYLRSFTKTLAQQSGEIYDPQYLSQEAYDSIVQSGIESGGRSSGNRIGNGNISNTNNGNGNYRCAGR